LPLPASGLFSQQLLKVFQRQAGLLQNMSKSRTLDRALSRNCKLQNLCSYSLLKMYVALSLTENNPLYANIRKLILNVNNKFRLTILRTRSPLLSRVSGMSWAIKTEKPLQLTGLFINSLASPRGFPLDFARDQSPRLCSGLSLRETQDKGTPVVLMKIGMSWGCRFC